MLAPRSAIRFVLDGLNVPFRVIFQAVISRGRDRAGFQGWLCRPLSIHGYIPVNDERPEVIDWRAAQLPIGRVVGTRRHRHFGVSAFMTGRGLLIRNANILSS